ncbi:erythromycin esterase family protein [Amycolatopsis sp. NPDC051061]|uniref:erythromycin esterase family protein n=1 Tax=Amycolatopsis sp. NPDC051061 TaxID=3155042 RepID=UPI003429733A
MSGTLLDDDVTAIREAATTLRSPQDLDPLVRRIGGARIVLLGASTHGTAEFHRWRAALTQRLLAERGFSFVAVEGDWRECHGVHTCVAGAPGAPNDPGQALWGFRRWPTWLWANEEVAEFAGRLRSFNATGAGIPCGFHGLDVHGLSDSLRGILGYLRTHAPSEGDAALRAFSCFEPSGGDGALVPADRREEVVRRLIAARSATRVPGLDLGFAEERNAEHHYRELLRGGERARNVHAAHLADTLGRLLRAYGPRSRAVVWAHDAQIGGGAELSTLGRLVRERHAADGIVAVGFGTYRGSVAAADRWGGPVRRRAVERARPESLEGVLHDALPGEDSLHVFDERLRRSFESREHRVTGVLRDGGYVPAAGYDAFVHCDETTAITPLHHWEPEEAPPFVPAQAYPGD